MFDRSAWMRERWRKDGCSNHGAAVHRAWEKGRYANRVLPIARLSRKAKRRWASGVHKDHGAKLHQRWLEGCYDDVDFSGMMKENWEAGAYDHIDRKAQSRRAAPKISATMEKRWEEGCWDHVDWSEIIRGNWRNGYMPIPFTNWRGTPTKYRGHIFRSKVEAHWAMELHEFGIKWRYESHRFILPDGSTYTPDFYLPRFHVWLEVKSDERNPVSSERKARMAIRAGIPIIIVHGPGCIW